MKVLQNTSLKAYENVDSVGYLDTLYILRQEKENWTHLESQKDGQLEGRLIFLNYIYT